MPLGVEKRKFAEYVEYVFLILGLLGFLLLAIFLFDTFLFFKKFFYFLAILLQIIFYFLSISFHKSGTILFVYTAGFFILNY